MTATATTREGLPRRFSLSDSTLHWNGTDYVLDLDNPLDSAIADAAAEVESAERSMVSVLDSLARSIEQARTHLLVGEHVGYGDSVLGSEPTRLDSYRADRIAAANKVSTLLHVRARLAN
jgi:hypothetical protein